MNSKRHLIFSALMVISLCCASAESTNAQTKSKSKGFDMKGFLGRIDTNKDGIVDSSEISDDRTRRFLERSGIDVSQPITIDAAAKIVNKKIQERASKKKSNEKGNLVSGFAVSERERGSTNGFAVSSEERQPAEKQSGSKVSKNISESAQRQAERTLTTYDRNKDGSLDADEMGRARWGSPPPSESDLNKDGSLSRGELATRYAARESGRSSSSSRESSRRSSRRTERSSSSPSRPRSSSSSSNTRSSSSSASTKSRRATDSYKKYVDGLFQTYDKDGDGKLSTEEIDKMRRKPANADADKDGFTTKDELIDFYTKRTEKRSGTSEKSSSSESKSRASRNRGSRAEKKPSGRSSRSSGSLSTLDKNGNGVIEMSEYSSEWDDDIVAEYYDKDKNRDGVITEKEWNGN
jgi:Ca2+-binding EF-hand superfamily protein